VKLCCGLGLSISFVSGKLGKRETVSIIENKYTLKRNEGQEYKTGPVKGWVLV
jgi:hypothetical protein